MITRMLQIDSARVSVGTAPTIVTPLSFLPVGIRGGDSLIYNGTTLPVSQVVSQMFHLTMQASDTIALKIRVPVQSVANLRGDLPIPIEHIPLKLKIGSAAGSINGVQPILTPDSSSMSMSTIAVDEEVVLDGIPVILGKDVYVDISDITIIPSRLTDVPYVTLNLDALIVPTWIADRSTDEWLGKTPATSSNSTDALNTNRLNEFLRTFIGNSQVLQVKPRSGGVTAFELYSPDTQQRAELLMNLPSNAIMIAFQRGKILSNEEAVPEMVTTLGWEPNWRAIISPRVTPGTYRRTPLLVASCTVSNNSISFPPYGREENGGNFAPVQFLILHNQKWPGEGLPAGDARLGLRVLVTPRLSSSSLGVIDFDSNLDLTIAGRDFASDPAPYNQSVAAWTKGGFRAAVFEGGGLGQMISASSSPSVPWTAEFQIKSAQEGTKTITAHAPANVLVTSNQKGNVLAVTSSGPIGAITQSLAKTESGNLKVLFPLLTSWAAQI